MLEERVDCDVARRQQIVVLAVFSLEVGLTTRSSFDVWIATNAGCGLLRPPTRSRLSP